MLKQNDPTATIRTPCHSTVDRVAFIESML